MIVLSLHSRLQGDNWPSDQPGVPVSSHEVWPHTGHLWGASTFPKQGWVCCKVPHPHPWPGTPFGRRQNLQLFLAIPCMWIFEESLHFYHRHHDSPPLPPSHPYHRHSISVEFISIHKQCHFMYIKTCIIFLKSRIIVIVLLFTTHKPIVLLFTTCKASKIYCIKMFHNLSVDKGCLFICR